MLCVDVVEHAVIGLCDDRHRPYVTVGKLACVVADHPFHRRMVSDSDAVRVGEADRAAEVSGILDPVRASHLAIPVERVIARPYGPKLRRKTAWQDRRDTRAHALRD